MLTLKKSMLLLFFLGLVSVSLADDKREDEAEEGEDKRAAEEERNVEKRCYSAAKYPGFQEFINRKYKSSRFG
uniref:Galensin n=1 Tax=Kassina senegalensis TaxID=8415 RepID=GALE_KASSE|nr:RecName: Full=Galensin; Flags: Precursor [Kassina senegalensis]CAC47951.1 galensin [Kassina senegalensis]